MEKYTKYLLLVLLIASFLIPGCTPTTTPTPTTTSEVAVSTTSTTSVIAVPSVEDFTFFSGTNNGTSEVFDAKEFTKATVTFKCDSDLFLKILVSNDGVNWIEQFNYYVDVCRQGKSETFNVSGRYYKATTTSPAASVNMVARFYN